MDAYLNSFVNDRVEKPVAKMGKENKATLIKSFKKLGKQITLKFKEKNDQPFDKIKVNKPKVFRGLGKYTSYYRDMQKTNPMNISFNEKGPIYWRGLRPSSKRNFVENNSSKGNFQKSIHQSSSQSVKSYDYWRGLRLSVLSNSAKNKSIKNDLLKIYRENASTSSKSYHYWRGLRP